MTLDLAKISSLKAGTTGSLLLSPQAAVRWVGGKILISSAVSGELLSTKDARSLQILHAFATPTEPQEVFRELDHFGHGFLFMLVSALWQIEALTAVREHRTLTTGAIREEPAAQSLSAEEASETAIECARSMAHLIRKIACDMSAFGAYLHGDGDSNVASSGKINLNARLEDTRHALLGVAMELDEKREPYIAMQLKKLEIESQHSKKLKLNLGSGAKHLAGWINIDLPPAELSMNLNWQLPFADESVEYVYSSHVLEHLYFRDEVVAFLREVRRVLASSGVVRLIVPDIEQFLRAYVEADTNFFETRKEHWPGAVNCETWLQQLLEYAGAGISPGNLWGHKFGYDFETVSAALRNAGFKTVTRSAYMQSAHKSLRVDAATRTPGFTHGNTHYSLFVEAA